MSVRTDATIVTGNSAEPAVPAQPTVTVQPTVTSPPPGGPPAQSAADLPLASRPRSFERIGANSVVRTIGEGGMGTVYEAIHDAIGRRAALKVLRPELSQNAEISLRFLNEARAVNVVNHPGVVSIFERPTSIRTAAPIPVGMGPSTVIVGDVNRDQRPDIVASNAIDNTLTVLLNGATGLTALPAIPWGGADPEYLVVADLNQDGSLDLAVSLYNANRLAVFLNTSQ